MNVLKKVLHNPGSAVRSGLYFGLGYWYKGWYALTRKNVQIGKNFRMMGRMSIKGPGKVIIGDNVKVGMVVTPWTCSKDAVLEIGNNVFLNGTRFSCVNNIKVGDDTMLADCRIMDTDFHTKDPARRREDDEETAPITIGKNAWITMQSVVLKGSVIGDNSIISPNSVVQGEVPANRIMMGNPARAAGWVTS